MSASIWNPGGEAIVQSNLSRVSQEFTATAGQTHFVLLIVPYTVGAENLEVYKNGEKLLPSVVTEVAGGASFYIAACALNDKIEAVVYPSTSAVFTELAVQAQTAAAAAAISEANAAQSAVLAATFSGGWQTANNTFTGLNTFAQPVNFTGAYGTLRVAGVDVMRFGSDTSGQLAGFRNLFINGNFNVRRRGTSFNLTAGAASYTLDRWRCVTLGGSGIVDTGAGSGLYLWGGVGTTGGSITQIIEADNCSHLAGSKAVFSAVIQSNLFTTVAVNVYRNVTRDSTVGCVLVNSLTLPVSNVDTKQSRIFDIPSSAIYGLLIEVVVTGAFTAAHNFSIKKAQFEHGSIDTRFEDRPTGFEEMLCQRYLPSFSAGAAHEAMGSGGIYNAVTGMVFLPFAVTPRIRPTDVYISTGAAFLFLTNAGQLLSSSVVVDSIGTGGVNFAATISGGVVGHGCVVSSGAAVTILCNGCEL